MVVREFGWNITALESRFYSTMNQYLVHFRVVLPQVLHFQGKFSMRMGVKIYERQFKKEKLSNGKF